MNFENQLKQWVQLDNQLKILNEQAKKLREQKNEFEINLTEYAKINNINNKLIRFNNDKLKIVDTKVHEPLTFKYLEKTLKDIIKNETQLKAIVEHIKQNRNMKIVSEIKRFSAD